MTEQIKNLKHIKVKGFKSIYNLDLPMEQINILIGANGAGKTNFISIFTFLSHLSQGKLKSYVAGEGGAERFFHFGSRNTESIVLDIQVGMNGYHVEFTPNFDDDSLVFSKEYCTIDSSGRTWKLDSRNGESGFRACTSSDYVARYTQEYLEKCRVYHFHDASNQAKFKKTNKLSNRSYLEKDAANIAPFLYFLKNSTSEKYYESYRQIVSAVASVAPFFHDFYLEPSGEEGDRSILLRWTHKDHDDPFSANVISDGTARFICLATLFLQPEFLRPDTIILDEPELGLHPAALTVLADIIYAVSKKTQVICSTQSVAFANLFKPENFIVTDAIGGASKFKRLNSTDLEIWLDEYGMGDIWAKNLIGGRPQW